MGFGLASTRFSLLKHIFWDFLTNFKGDFHTPPQARLYMLYMPSLWLNSLKLVLGSALISMSAVWALIGV